MATSTNLHNVKHVDAVYDVTDDKPISKVGNKMTRVSTSPLLSTHKSSIDMELEDV